MFGFLFIDQSNFRFFCVIVQNLFIHVYNHFFVPSVIGLTLTNRLTNVIGLLYVLAYMYMFGRVFACMRASMYE